LTAGNFGFLYSSGFGFGWPYWYDYGWSGYGYGWGWPSYIYDPYCAYDGSATYIIDSPGYAALPSIASDAPIDSSASIVTDATAANAAPQAIAPRSAESNYVPPGLDPAETSQADFARQGELAFENGDYNRAVREWRHALLDEPQNGTLVLMTAQALFQLGQYNESAGAVQAGFQLVPRENWGVVVANYQELYGDTQDYVDQLKALEKAIKEKPKEAGLRLLVGYHYLYLGYPSEAIRELKVGEELAKTDQAMKELLKAAEEVLEKKQASAPKAPLPGPPADPPAAAPVEPPQKPDSE
jgi:tetratricopeptide (TPR) repeat protein